MKTSSPQEAAKTDWAEIPRRRKIHFGWLWNKNGGVSPMCAKKPRRIGMGHKSKETWTITPRFVTCPKCRTMLVNTGRISPALTPKVEAPNGRA